MSISVPIRGLFNLTEMVQTFDNCQENVFISVPIRGLFNLTSEKELLKEQNAMLLFPSPSGDYLI